MFFSYADVRLGTPSCFKAVFWFQIKDAKLDKFRAIASEPKDKNAFKIENYDGLTGVLENFQKDVFVMEGGV